MPIDVAMREPGSGIISCGVNCCVPVFPAGVDGVTAHAFIIVIGSAAPAADNPESVTVQMGRMRATNIRTGAGQ